MRYTISLAMASLVALPALAEVPAVVTDIAPVHALVAMVMGDLGTPVLLLDKGADPHDFQLRPSQAQAVATAGLVVWIGPQMSTCTRSPGAVTRGAARRGTGARRALKMAHSVQNATSASVTRRPVRRATANTV